MPRTFATEFVLPVDAVVTRQNAIREFVPVFGRDGFQMTAQSAEGLTFSRRYLSGWAFLGGLLIFPVGILVWLFVKRTEIVTVSLTAHGPDRTRVLISGRAPAAMLLFINEMKEKADELELSHDTPS
jgi:hypothetical protein